MRTQTELLSDLSRLDGGRFDDTVFELFHRGPKSIDRLRSFAESASLELRAKIEASVVRQWTRVQELLANLDPAALSSPGVKYALGLGPADAIARRALRSIERGEYETAACLAAALPEETSGRYDGAELESLLAMASGRPERALELLRPYLAPGAHTERATPMFARAALAAGRFSKAYPALHSEALVALIGGADSEGLGECVYQVATSGRPEMWKCMAEGICEAVASLAAECQRAVRDWADPTGDLVQAVEAVRYAADDLAQAGSEGLARSLRLELAAAAEELARQARTAAEALSELIEADHEELVATAGSLLEGEGFSAAQISDEPTVQAPTDGAKSLIARWFKEVQGFGAGGSRQDAGCPSRVRVIAGVAGLGVKAFWAGGRRIIELVEPTPGVPAERAERSIDFDSPDCVSATLAVLRGSVPALAAEGIVAQAITFVRARTRACARDGVRVMLDVINATGSDDGPAAREASGSVAGAESSALLRQAEAWRSVSAWLGLAPWPDAGGVDGQRCGDEEAGQGGECDGENPEQAGDDRLSDTEQAWRTASMLVRAAAAGQLPDEQCELIPFLMTRAVMGTLERERGDELATYRLRPTLIDMIDRAGKRRREFRPAAIARLSEALGTQWDAVRVRATLEKLCSIVLDGANRKVTAEPTIAGLALVGAGLASGDADQLLAGQALARLALVLQRVQARAGDGRAQGRGDHGDAHAIWSELEEAATDAFEAVARRKPV